MRISDWSSDVCSSDLALPGQKSDHQLANDRIVAAAQRGRGAGCGQRADRSCHRSRARPRRLAAGFGRPRRRRARREDARTLAQFSILARRSEEHTSELQSLMRISSDVFFLITYQLPTSYTTNTII